jgi:hypothetical protein
LRSICVQSSNADIEIAPAYRDKAAKALMHELRRTKLGLYFTFARLYCLKFALQSRSAVLRLLRKAARDLRKRKTKR